MIRIAIVGLDYWGSNLVRCFSDLKNCKVTADQSIKSSSLSCVKQPKVPMPFQSSTAGSSNSAKAGAI